MFAGHYGAGLGAKAAEPRVGLWALFLGVRWLDVVWSILVLAMPLVGDSAKVGLHQWSSAPATFVVELLIVAAGLALYLRATVATSGFGRVAPRVLALILVVTCYSTVFGESTDVDAAATAGPLSTAVIFPVLVRVVELRRRPRPLTAGRAARAPSPALGR